MKSYYREAFVLPLPDRHRVRRDRYAFEMGRALARKAVLVDLASIGF